MTARETFEEEERLDKCDEKIVPDNAHQIYPKVVETIMQRSLYHESVKY